VLAEVEPEPPRLVPADRHPVWQDDDSGFTRRSVSPSHPGLRGELVEGMLRPGADISYDGPSVPGLEQHIWVLEGTLEATAEDAAVRAGVTLLLLDTATGSAGDHLYRAAGWTRYGIVPGYASDPAGSLEDGSFYYKRVLQPL
jgi:hypothetical protein